MTTLPTSIPPLPISLITALLPHLLPPSPLPQEFLSKSLLQRLLYLPPSPSDLDSHLSPFPADDAQPISTRLNELSHGHRLGDIQYTKELDEVYARINILPEHDGLIENSVEVWLEFEYGNSESRGWVYHSARIPSTTAHTFVSSPEQLSIISETEAQNDDTIQYDIDNGNNEAPSGYWTAFDSPTSSPSPHTDILDDQHVEDAYWAQYSRPATAPITPGIHTPSFHPYSKPKADTHEEQAKKLTESLKALGLGHGDLGTANGYSKIHTEGKRGFWVDEEEKEEKEHVEEVGKEDKVQGVLPSQDVPVIQTQEVEEEEETGSQVKDRLKCKILVSLNQIWKEHIEGSSELDLEVKAMEWLNYGKTVTEDTNLTASPISSNDAKGDVIVGKLEILFEMYQVLREKDEKDSFYRLLEGTIRKPPSLGDQQDEFGLDDVHRQNTYYE
ncbi:hypothetical protein I302_104682 [Kwoniella bestiolae CBS 10118]|uniref:Uncharacterized protein n=1 Tax=Kwoniella bestiolae CBS 10118 TaxID=1296100 RepID=A0A1B9FS23_9TREE|nr:hypothetical protein I302_09249 [Kwoniella bestiolae CBS 10118]OCF21570.1 hypothetical protein I302_09249 [Kwoniella bestiolae CBS 10118]